MHISRGTGQVVAGQGGLAALISVAGKDVAGNLITADLQGRRQRENGLGLPHAGDEHKVHTLCHRVVVKARIPIAHIGLRAGRGVQAAMSVFTPARVIRAQIVAGDDDARADRLAK